MVGQRIQIGYKGLLENHFLFTIHDLYVPFDATSYDVTDM
jgi:hypothetical protein